METRVCSYNSRTRRGVESFLGKVVAIPSELSFSEIKHYFNRLIRSNRPNRRINEWKKSKKSEEVVWF